MSWTIKMANSRRRCGSCKNYFSPSDMFKTTEVQAFCSEKCLKASPRLGRKANSKVPGGTRNKVFERFKHMCAYCGRSGSLQVHHIKYRSEGVDHSLDNLILLCQEHHEMVHSNKKKWQPLLKEFVAAVSAGTIRAVAMLPVMEKQGELA
jgi:5-methylcytosine-specific restriction endonuclease McrA